MAERSSNFERQPLIKKKHPQRKGKKDEKATENKFFRNHRQIYLIFR